MNQMNQIILEGNIVRISEKETSGGTFVLSLTVATSRGYKSMAGEKSSEVSYFDCQLWGDYGKKMKGRCGKGKTVRIVGRLKQDRWKDESGKQFSRVFVVVEHIDFLPLEDSGKENF